MYENTNQPEIMRDRYKALPPPVTELFEYGTVDFVLDNIVREFALGDEQKEALRMEIELVLYFFLPRIGFVERLQDSLEIDQSKAEQIYTYIEENLFIIVDDILTFTDKKLTGSEEAKAVLETPPPPPNPPKPVAPTPLPPSGKPSFITKVDTPPAKPIAPEKSTQTTTSHSNVKPLRTFAEDVELSRAHSYGAFRSNTPETEEDDEPVHRSSQDDIIKK